MGWLDLFRRKTRTLGERGEAVAATHLKAKGCRILARNLRSRVGEIDLLAEAEDRRTIVVVEVKAGRIGNTPPEVHVNAAKQRKLAQLAAGVLRRDAMRGRPLRFDVVAVEFGDDETEPVVRHHVGAFAAGW